MLTLLQDYTGRLKEMNHPLRLLVENELFRLSVWANPANDPKRGADHVSSITEVSPKIPLASAYLIWVVSTLGRG